MLLQELVRKYDVVILHQILVDGNLGLQHLKEKHKLEGFWHDEPCAYSLTVDIVTFAVILQDPLAFRVFSSPGLQMLTDVQPSHDLDREASAHCILSEFSFLLPHETGLDSHVMYN